MPKLLIVDDEEMIRAGLSQMVPRLLPEWEVVGACPDAASAWEAVLLKEPELVLLDIGMPGDSGLTLADKLARLKPDITVIMLTGYDRFEYVQSALRSGVVEYLLKPVQRDELKEAILKAGGRIAKRHYESGKLLSQALSEWIVAGEEKALNTLLELLAGEGHTGLDMSYQLQLTVYTQPDLSGTGSAREDRLARAANQVETLTRFGAEIRKWAVVPLAKTCDLLFLAGKSLGDASRRRVQEDNLPPDSEARALIPNMTANGLTASSDPVAHPTELPDCFRQAQERLLGRMAETNVTPAEEAESLSRLTLALEMNDLAGTVAVLRQRVESWKQLEPFQALRGIISLIALFAGPRTERINSNLLQQMRPAIDELTGRLLFAYDPGVLLQEMERFIERISRLEPQAQEERKVILKVKEIIKSGYANSEFTLEQVASSVYLNATYLSELFKESTGQKFIDFVTDVRLNEARRMLLETDMKMSEVCAAVGYTSSKYFSTLFRKRFHVTPTQYRESGSYPNVTTGDSA
ncbi:response regulator [Paenibacillus pasadenensis]|uniref:response regulator n=1 Tax=Paenibacillus pasadenensis TaxID=217090 RepID=UPI0020408B9B|nr:response regulator [Paenibacillus pasadenensis]MCM3747025.1 response regulator [Paenibacillus pasadenensis]